MHTVVLKPFVHRSQEVIGLAAPYTGGLNIAVRKLKGVKWSQTHGIWYLPLSKDSYAKITSSLQGVAVVNDAQLRAYLIKRRAVSGTIVPKSNAEGVAAKAVFRKPLPITVAWHISPENRQALTRLLEQLKLKAYSASTTKTYRNGFLELLQLLKKKNVNDLKPDDLRRYFVYCFEKLKLSENTLHSRINAVKFYFEQVLHREKFFWEIPRPKKPEQLPNVLSEREIVGLFNSLQNLKHKAILFCAYSAGLRVSEVVGLRLKDIDSDRMQIKIVGAKGKKDRYVTLSPVLLQFLRHYIRQSSPRPQVFLFESGHTAEAYSSRSAQKLFQRAKATAGIKKDVSFHSLWHSFATHLLEKGTDIRFIKEILGHLSLQTTERYTHVTVNQLVQIKSPLDDLWAKGDIR